ncbi:MAG: DUF6049 family protein [Actinomycetota bacterium]|nr:DUF6049 family protein [Actinomycetota bacterium]
MTAGLKRRRLRAVLAVVSLAALLQPLVVPFAAAAPAATSGRNKDSLRMTLTSIEPSALRPGRPLTLKGRVTNTSPEPWRAVQVYLVMSPSPLTTHDELAATNDSPAGSYFGDRVTEIGTFARLGRLSPDEQNAFRVKVPWKSLPISGVPGVYTVGAQVLATDVDGTRTGEALGRTRTYVPLADPAKARPVEVAMIWRLGAQVLRRRDGTYARTAALTSSMASDGALRRLVGLGSAAGSVPITVVPDLAVLDAARDIGSGRYGPPGGLVNRIGLADEATPAAAGSSGTAAARERQSGAPDPDPASATWFEDARTLVADHPGWTTTYGEASVDTLAAVGSQPLSTSIALATRAAQRRLLDRKSKILHLPDAGILSTEGLDQLAAAKTPGTTVLSPRMLPGWDSPDGAPQRIETASEPLDVVVADPTLAAGGPAPGEPLSALQVRQRLLAETALLAAQAPSRRTGPISATFVTPDGWNPGPDWASANFFEGLDVPWLKPVSLGNQLRDEPGPARYRGNPGVPDESELSGLAEVAPAETTAAALQLRRRVRLLASLVGGGRDLQAWYASAVALAISESTLRDPGVQQRLIQSVAARVTQLLRGVRLTGPSFVTLSSSRGSFPLTVTNELDRTVTISVQVQTMPAASTSDRARFETAGQFTVAPGQRDTVSVEARVEQPGVTSAAASVATADGRPFGAPLTFSLRTSVVGVVIWGILGIACAVLVLAMVRRLLGRGRQPGTQAGTQPGMQ